MKRIGLTGGIASGKSTASSILRELGAVIIDADAAAHELAEKGQPLYEAYVRHFGRGILRPDGSLDRRRLGQLVFTQAEEKAWLDQTSHPLIRAAMKKKWAEAEAKGVKAVVLDIPLLFETGWQKKLDETWLIYVPEEVQLLRLQQRNGYPCAEAMSRIKAQMPIEEKRNLADRVIDNTGSREALQAKLKALWQDLMAENGQTDEKHEKGREHIC